MSQQGMLAIVLHAHLPYVRHPESHDFLEERWLFEAITETYLPLLTRLERMVDEGLPVRLTMSFSPTLLTMLADPLLQSRYVRYLDQSIQLAGKEIQRNRWRPGFQRLALFYQHRLNTARHQILEIYHWDLIGAFRKLVDQGVIELMASCATHSYLPLMEGPKEAIRAQIALGMEYCAEAFGRRPEGFWLPECGFRPGHDALLKAEGVRYVITDAHGLLFGNPRPKFGVYAPIQCPSGIAAFGRDLETSRSVWGDNRGYPAHPDYREFYRDIGYELDYEYLRPHLDSSESRLSTGMKYYRITGPTEEKELYNPDRALEQAARDAAHFIAQRKRQCSGIRRAIGRNPLLVAPFDAELFGHWWFEGPDWLEMVIRKMQTAPRTLTLTTPGDYLRDHPKNQPLEPAMSSWGAGGYNDIWLNGSNDWIYRHLHQMADRMVAMATAHPHTDPLRQRALNQMARELLLAQASDWTFILKAKTHTAYAYQRLNDHLARFTRLYESVAGGDINELWLSDLEAKDAIFPSLDYRLYAAHSSSRRNQ